MNGIGRGLIVVLPKHSLGVTEENNEKLHTASVQAEIRIENLQNTNVQCYHYTSLISSMLSVTEHPS
jgi:hypothetical protein